MKNNRCAFKFIPFIAASLTLQLLSAIAGEADTLAGVIQPFVERKALAGAVMLVANKEKVLCVETAGFADIAAGKSMPPDATFWIASMTKPFTAAALMILVDDGKVKIDDPVEKYLPEFKGQMVTAEQDAEHVLLKKPAQPPTIKHILFAHQRHEVQLADRSADARHALFKGRRQVLRDDAAAVGAGQQVSVLKPGHQHRGANR
jgi:CubicO group peptidase (beta-lactamase class C family)